MGLSVILPSNSIYNLTRSVPAVRALEPDARVIVIDDGVEWPVASWKAHRTREPLAHLVVPGVKPFCYARNCNLGIQAAGDDDVVLLNDDAILKTTGGFTLLQNAQKALPEYGVLSAVTNVVGNVRQRQSNFTRLLRTETEYLCFVCVYIPRCTIHTVGLLDERYTGYGYDDNDYSERVKRAGLKLGIHDDCFVDHLSLKSAYRGDGFDVTKLAHNKRLYEEKWA